MLDPVLLSLILIVLLASIASIGWDVFEMRNREAWWWTCILALEAWFMPNPYMGALVGLIVLGMFQIGRSWFILRSFFIPVCGLAGAYLVMAPHVKPWMIGPVLWAGLAVGVFLGAWAIIGFFQPRPFEFKTPKSWCGMWGIYEHMEGSQRTICGQGNTMHLMAISSLCIGCVVGLAWIGQPWALLALPVCVMPLYACRRVDLNWHPNQGDICMAFLALGLLWLWQPWAAAGLFALMLIPVVYIAHPSRRGFNTAHLRLAYWIDAILLVWWPQGWKHRLFGFGSNTWFMATCRMAESRKHQELFTAAHNEWVQQLVEHGAVGLLVLCAYFADALWRTLHGGSEGQAVFLLGMVWLAISLVNFPATWYHEYHPVNDTQEHWFGSPSLNAWTFILAIIVEAF